VYWELVRFVDLHGYVPSYQELADLVGCSRSTIKRHMDRLQEAGLVVRKAGAARSIVIRCVE
jgi:DNA-binding GntR family transcriptional regulator